MPNANQPTMRSWLNFHRTANSVLIVCLTTGDKPTTKLMRAQSLGMSGEADASIIDHPDKISVPYTGEGEPISKA